MRVLLATDGSEFSAIAIDKACEFVNPESAVFKVISVYENPPPVMAEPGMISPGYYQEVADGLKETAQSCADQGAARIRKHFSGRSVDVASEILNGFPDKEIIELAKDWKADLIVVGSHGRGFWGRLLGSVSDGVVHHAPCSVLIVRGPGN